MTAMTTTLACPKCGGSGGGQDPALRCSECGGTGRPRTPDDDVRDDLNSLRVTIEQQAALVTELADALRAVLRESADGVFAPGYRSVRQALVALEKVRRQ